jgi:hypothetical protein
MKELLLSLGVTAAVVLGAFSCGESVCDDLERAIANVPSKKGTCTLPGIEETQRDKAADVKESCSDARGELDGEGQSAFDALLKELIACYDQIQTCAPEQSERWAEQVADCNSRYGAGGHSH